MHLVAVNQEGTGHTEAVGAVIVVYRNSADILNGYLTAHRVTVKVDAESCYVAVVIVNGCEGDAVGVIFAVIDKADKFGLKVAEAVVVTRDYVNGDRGVIDLCGKFKIFIVLGAEIDIA